MAQMPKQDPKPALLFPKAGSEQLPISVSRWFRKGTGFFTQSPDMIIKCTEGDSVLNAPLTVGKAAGPAFVDQI